MKRMMIIVGLALLATISAGAQEHTDYKLPEKPKRAAYVHYADLDKGLWFAVQASVHTVFAYGSTDKATALQGVELIAGYRFGEFFRLGGGVAIRHYLAPSDGFPIGKNKMMFGINALPVFLDLRGNIISQESRMAVPYWSFDAGYAVNEGLFLSPTVGVRIGRPRNDFIAGITYYMQKNDALNKIMHGFGLRIGFEF